MSSETINKDLTEDEVLTEDSGVFDEVDFATEDIIKSHVIASMALGLVPVPLFDIAALSTTQLSLLRQLCEYYEVPFENFDLKSILTSLVSGSIPALSVIGLSSLIKVIPGIGSVAGMAGLSLTAGSVTYAVGKVFSKHFENGGTFDDFNPREAQRLFKSEFEYGKSVAQSIKDQEESANPSDLKSD